jgi:hypothetical protein
MAKQKSDVELITGYFQTADESAATVMLQVVQGIVAARFDKPVEKTKRARGPNKAKDSGLPKCATCGNVESYADHQPDSDVYHIFRTSLKKSKPNGEDKSQGASA